MVNKLIKASHKVAGVIVHPEGVVVSLDDKRLIAKIGIDKQTGKESLVFYPVISVKRVTEGWKIDVDEEHQISEKEGIARMYGTSPKTGTVLLPVSMRSKTGELILGIARAKWELGGNRTSKLTPFSIPIPATVYQNMSGRKGIDNIQPEIIPVVWHLGNVSRKA